jgi:competence protein ComEC
MRTAIVFFALGVWALQRAAELPALEGAWALLLLVTVLGLSRFSGASLRWAGIVALAVLAFSAGYYWAAARAHARIADALPLEWEGRDMVLVGVVASLPQVSDRSVRFELDVESVFTPGARAPRRVALSWWGRGGALPQVHAGERWRFHVRLKRPHGSVNPHGFDYEAWLLERGVRATGYVRGRPPPERMAALVQRPGYWVEALRERLRARVLDALAERPYAGIIAALAVGDQRAIPQPQWQTFTRTGVNHLMSISGLHVTMVAGLVYALALAVWRRSARLVLLLPAPKAAALAGVAGAFLYTLLAGFAVPAQRTLYMVCVVAAALWAGLPAAASSVLALALLAVLVIDPWAVTSAGFWLSFGAVAAILFVMVNRIAQPGWLTGWARTQTAVTLLLVPLLLALFQQVSVISPIANAFAIPLVSLVVVPLALAGTILPIDFVLVLAHFAMACCMYVLEWMSALPESVWQQHAPPQWAIAIAFAGALWLMLPRGFPGRWLGAIAWLPLFLVLPPLPRPGEVKMAVLDVGQGLAVVVRTASHALVYDAGPAFGPAADSGNRIIAPYLRASGIRSLDALVVSHDDIDHTGGAISLMQALPVAWLVSSLPDTDPLQLIADRAYRCFAGQSWAWDGVRFDIIHPSRASYDARARDNDRSCVLRITAPGGTVLLPGDIERRAEEALLRSREALSADVLIAPHQGSRTSSTPEFVRAVRPRAVIFPVGNRNRFGHPHEDVLERYMDSGAAHYRTDRDGALLVSIATDGAIAIERQRAADRRYWRAAP